MEQTGSSGPAHQSLREAVVALGKKAFSPDSDDAAKSQGRRELNALLERTSTVALIPTLNWLIRPGLVPEWLRARIMEILTLLPLRPDGVRSTLEFVFSVHPSSTVRLSEAATLQKRGANITQEALTMATRLLATPPTAVDAETWYSGISSQIMALLDGQDSPELARVAAYVVGYGVLGRKQLGAPGTSGWKYFAEPMLRAVNPSIGASDRQALPEAKSSDDIIDLSEEMILTKSADLSLALHRLLNLATFHPNPGLSKRLLKPLSLSLWSLSSWPKTSPENEERACLPARKLLRIYLTLATSTERFMEIIHNLNYIGVRQGDGLHWVYRDSSDGIQVVSPREVPGYVIAGQLDWDEVDNKATAFVTLINEMSSEADIPSIFTSLFKTWLSSSQRGESIHLVEEEGTPEGETAKLFEIKVLQEMMQKCSEKLVERTGQLLELIGGILADQRSSDDEESLTVVLSLLNLVVTAPNFQKAKVKDDLLRSIEESLDKLSNGAVADISNTATNLALLLKYRDDIEEPSATSAPSERQVEDRKTYSLAVSYITQLDSPPPVRSEGLNLIAGLIQANSSVLDIPGILALLSAMLKDNEDYINLRVIKIFTQLADRHPRSVTRDLLENYVDAQEKETVDTRLRFGEALVQVIERLGETFAGETALQVGQALLSTAGRRGHRPKTEAMQAREERLRKAKQRDAEEAWGGDVPDLSGKEHTQQQIVRNAILEKIVEGWESKRGAEDVRIRASALSILTTGIETNIAGTGSTLVSAAVDLALNILTLEPEMEKGILRRIAILLVMGFLRALDGARQKGKRLGFGLTEESQQDISRILQYVARTDNDGLVQQHARDVLESLENWQMSRLIPEARDDGGKLTNLAGLEVNPGIGAAQDHPARPRIEEIE